MSLMFNTCGFNVQDGDGNYVPIQAFSVQGEVKKWLDDHPEATTTVEDDSITEAKLEPSLRSKVDDALSEVPSEYMKVVSIVGGLTLEKANGLVTNCCCPCYSSIANKTGWGMLLVAVTGDTIVQTLIVAGKGACTRVRANNTWSDFE